MGLVRSSGWGLFSLTLAIGFAYGAAIGHGTVVTSAEAHSQVGERVRLCDRVSSTGQTETVPEGPVRIQLGQLRLLIPGGSQRAFGQLDRLRAGIQVCVTGLVEMDRNVLKIVVTDPAQLSIQDSEFAPAALFSRSASDDEEIRRVLVVRSKESYSGPCPCPDSLDGSGKRCGRRSAYSRSGGTALLCSVDDVTDEMVREYRKRL